MNDETLSCYFCGSDDVILPEIGISFGMGGADYSFCRKCLEGMTASEFWARMTMHLGYSWPPKMTKND